MSAKSTGQPTPKTKPAPVVKVPASVEDRRDAAVAKAALAKFEASGEAPIPVAEVKKRLSIE
jgi:hypothetical protein